MTLEWISQAAVPVFATLFVVIDPVGLVPVFLSLTAGMSPAARRLTAWRAVALAFALLVMFTLFGEAVLQFLAITVPAFRIAGGVLLFVLALEMLFEKRSRRRQQNAEDATAHGGGGDGEDVWVFPLALPLIAGPGAMTSVILLADNAAHPYLSRLVIIAVAAIVVAITLAMFLVAGRIQAYLPETATRAMTRILGIVLAALAVQFILTGLKSAGIAA